MPPTSTSGIAKTGVTPPMKGLGMSMASFKSKNNTDNGDNTSHECNKTTKCNNNIEKAKNCETSELNNIMFEKKTNTPNNLQKEFLEKPTPGFTSSLLANPSLSSTNFSSQLNNNGENRSTEGQDVLSINPHNEVNENKDSEYNYF